MMTTVGTRSDETSGPPPNVPELELGVRTNAAPKAKPKRVLEPESPLELAVDPQALVLERASSASATTSPPARILAQQVASAPMQTRLAGAIDVVGDARLLADCGDPPRHWLGSPLYAWRVLKRRRALKLALIGRRSEAVGAASKVDDAFASFAALVRATALENAAYMQTIEELQCAEEVQEARDGLVAAEREARKERLSQLDARLANLQAEVARAVTDQPADARGRASEERRRVEAARLERDSLEQWLKRQGQAQTAAAEQAREHVRHQMMALAKSAVLDRSVFGVDFDPAREEMARLQLAAQSADRDVTVHEAALNSYDERSMRQGLIVAAVLVLVLVVAPVVWRATRVVEPPGTHVLTDH